MRTLLFAALVLAQPAIGSDFRGTEFGHSCAGVPEREKALGSELVQVSVDGNAYRFKGRAFDRDASVIIYLCKEGALSLGHVQFPEGKYPDAVADYLAAHNLLVSLLGAPVLGYARHRDSRAELAVPAVGAATRDEYYAFWRAQEISVSLFLMTRRDYSEDSWFAMVVTTPARK